jgi:catechol 2,3-dioxygenase-like lactoylglutathione lyase family enzyme
MRLASFARDAEADNGRLAPQEHRMKHTHTTAFFLASIMATTLVQAQAVPRTPNPDAYKTDPKARVLPPGDIGHSPIFSPRFDGPYDPNPTVAEGRTPLNGPSAPPSLNLSEASIPVVTINVLDMEAQRAWYEKMLGMKVLKTYHRNGVLYEYLMGYSHNRGAKLALAKEPRPAGYNNNGRLGFDVPNTKELAAFLYSQGALMREGINGRVYFVIDPEGNPIEFFTLPKADPTPKK